MTLSQEWAIISEAMYGSEFTVELADLLKENNVHKVLECGCGNGNILDGLAKRGFEGVGIDGSQEMIEEANKRHSNPKIEYRQMNWLEIDQIDGSFDAVICRGNSLGLVKSWDVKESEFSAEESGKAVNESIKKMWDKVKSGGILYLDTVAQKDIDQGGGDVEVELPNISLKGRITIDLANRIRQIKGGGQVEGRNYSGGSISYIITALEISEILRELGARKVWSPKLEHEINYDIICAKK